MPEPISLEAIEAAKTPNGGWTKAQLAEWGVPWPPPKGWKERLTAGLPAKEKFRKLKAKQLPRPKLDINGLNLKQRTFVDEYLKDLNATQAALRAGYSEKTAHVQGCQLLKNPKVAAVISNRTAERARECHIDQDWLLKRLAEEARADINDLYENNGLFKPVSEWPMIWRTGLIEQIKMGDVVIDETGKTERRPIEIKVSGRIKRVELIGKHVAVQAFRDRVDHGLTPGTAEAVGEAITQSMTAKQAAERYREKLG